MSPCRRAQVLAAALELAPASEPSRASRDGSDGGSRRSSSGSGTALSRERVGAELRGVMGRAEESARAAGEGMEAEEQLPDACELAYRAALGLARGAAVDELLGNAAASMRAYSKVGATLAPSPCLLWPGA